MVYSYPLTAKSSVENLPPIVIFTDTETRGDDDGRQTLELGCYEIWAVDEYGRQAELLENGDYSNERGFYSLLEDFAPCRIVAHNWDFDASVLRIGSSENMSEYGYTIDVARSICPPTGQGYAPFFLVLKLADDRKVELICNTNFFKMSLADLGESIGFEKWDMPDVDDRASLLAYCKRDVEIMRRAWFDLFRFVSAFDTTPGLTAAMCAMRVFRSTFYDDEWNAQGSEHIELVRDAEKAAYHGGRTDVFWKGTPQTDRAIRRYDVNSLYPSVMLDKVPVRYEGRVLPAAIGTTGYQMLIHATLRIPDTPLGDLGLEGVMIDGKLLFPRGTFSVWLWQPLYEIALELGWIADVKRVFAYRAEPIFKGYVDKFYTDRMKYKSDGNRAYDGLCKLLMNSLYGKFGQRRMANWELVEDEKERRVMSGLGDRFSGIYDTDIGEVHYWQVGSELYRMIPFIGDLAASSICSIAGYITAVGRAQVWQAMRSIVERGGQVYMCDTDSVVCDIELPRGMVSSTKIGKWKLESELASEKCVFVAPKHYKMERWKIKGIRQASGAASFAQDVFPKFRTDLLSTHPDRRKRLETGAVISEVVKHPTGLNTKRQEHGDGRPTTAYSLNMVV